MIGLRYGRPFAPGIHKHFTGRVIQSDLLVLPCLRLYQPWRNGSANNVQQLLIYKCSKAVSSRVVIHEDASSG
jgi:hypothetical protein